MFLPVVYEEARETGVVVDDPGEDFVPAGQDQQVEIEIY